MQAITVEYKTSAITGSAYLVAICEAGRKRQPRYYDVEGGEQALNLAAQYAEELNWLRGDFELAQGSTHTGDWVHVLVPISK